MSARRRRWPAPSRAWGLILLAAAFGLAGWVGLDGGPAGYWLDGWPVGTAGTAGAEHFPCERMDGLHFTIFTDQGQVLLQTGRMVYEGDEFVDRANRHWRVVSVEGDRATAVPIGIFSLEVEPVPARAAGPAGRAGLVPVAAVPQTARVAVYHTHGDESYVVGDGTESKPRGGIVDVGNRMVQAMRAKGADVQHNTSRHAPHDAGSYRRSRRTAAALLRQGAGTLLDLHRDAAPRAAYETKVDGQPASQVMLVVGRANPQMQTSLNFARSFKRVLDERYPDLVRGIYFGRGSYNQDLSPRAMLLEVGSHRTPKDHALRTADLVGRAMPAILGFMGAPASGAEAASRANLVWILLVVLLGGAAYLVLASGGLRPAWAKLGGMVRRRRRGGGGPGGRPGSGPGSGLDRGSGPEPPGG